MTRGRPELPPPTREEVLRWLEATPDARRRDLLAAFAAHGRDKLELKRTLRELEAEGLIDLRRRRVGAAEALLPDRLPPVAVVDVTAIDEEGDLVLRAPEQPRIRIVLPVETLGRGAPGLGDRLLARLRRLPGGTYEARLLKLLPKVPREVVGRLSSAPPTASACARPTAGRGRNTLSPRPTAVTPTSAIWSVPRSSPAAASRSRAPASSSASAGRTTRGR